MQELPVLFSEKLTDNGKVIAIAELNAAKSLNALSLPMILLLTEQLALWDNNKDVAVVVLKGSGDKAFCAGGDVVSLYQHLKDESYPISDEGIKSSQAIDFFKSEYYLDQLIHNYTKPILAWANGYVMGGGVGLMAGASHRVSTEKTLMAMPEVTIGLYPDVGATWFLNKMPDNIGLFLGLTGAMFNGVDARYLGLADHLVNSEDYSDIQEKLISINWQTETQNHKYLENLLTEFTLCEENEPNSLVIKHSAAISEVTRFDKVADIYQAIISDEFLSDVESENDNKWLNQTQQKLLNGSPLSAAIIHEQLKRYNNYTLAQCFESELNLSLRCCQQTEFSEGVRALLVDKDKNPQWRYMNINDIDKNTIEWFFKPLHINI